MSQSILFMRTAWMNEYCGLPPNEVLKSGASQIVRHKFGHEIYNFQPYNSRMYGFAHPLGGTINISRLGAPKKSSYASDVLVIWTAPRPKVGVVIVGWYKHAKVYRIYQRPPMGAHRTWKKETIGYYASGKVKDCRLLQPIDMRVFPVSGMGQSLIWYADDPAQADFVKRVRNYVASGGTSYVPHTSPKKKSTWQLDSALRLAVERGAIKRVGKYFEDLGYDVRSVENDKKGWDLEARLRQELLRIEVKGRNGEDISAELTPNEYQQLTKYQDSYRICIVTRAISKNPDLHLFAHSSETDVWNSNSGRQLLFEKKTGAVISC